jgi:hypothetical protein
MIQGLRAATIGTIVMMTAGAAVAQGQRPSGTKGVMHDIVVTTAEGSYIGTIDLVIDRGKVSGDMVLTTPTEITAKVAGVSKAGLLALDFPFTMTQRNCTGNVTMSITMPARPGPAKGTMEAVGCGREPGNKLAGTVELKPSAEKPAQK